MNIQLNVNLPRGGEKTIDLCDDEEALEGITVLQLREKITKELKIEDAFRMVFGKTTLEGETNTLVSYQIQHLSTVQIVLKMPGGIR